MQISFNFFSAILLLCSTAFSGMAQSVPGKKISIADFTPLRGEWKGNLTYLDYSSNKPVTLPANTKFEMVSDSSFDQFIYYTSEPHKNDGTRYTIKENGQLLNDMKLLTRRKNTDGSLELVFEYRGPDGNDNRMATMLQVMQFSKHELVITKKVKYDGTDQFIQRHQYRFTAKPSHQ
jgi:hypothetical protein